MADWSTSYTITNETDQEMLDTVEWLRDNLSAKINNAQAQGVSKTVSVGITDTSFEDAVTTLLAMKAQFTTRLADSWNLNMQ